MTVRCGVAVSVAPASKVTCTIFGALSYEAIVIIVCSGEHLMGDVFESSEKPLLQIFIQAPQSIAQLHVICDNQYVYTAQPNKSQFELQYTDTTVEPGTSCYHYVRVQQTDGNLAWASPMWITYRP